MMRTETTMLAIFFLLVCATAQAAPPPSADTEFLEFIGDFETAAGKPVDPFQFREETKKNRQPEEEKGENVSRKTKAPERKGNNNETAPGR
jgi:hypothetical protein